ncbi:hypothetical protein DFH29DRAFT_983956 [Suillus ampliporus]|nr:hypothetical protein DFH29DRAFT_983956 [Suillus ampliporus]
MASCGLTKRGTRFLILAVLLCFVLPGILYQLEIVQNYFNFNKNRRPPLYQDYREREQHLEHYKEYQTKKDVKYLWSANHAKSSGWGNVMQDYVMNGLLAHATGRSYVFDDYVWNPDGSVFSDYNGNLIPSRIPLTALLGGKYNIFFRKVCPNPTVIRTSEVNDDNMRFSEDVPASLLFEKWLEKINSIDDPCLEVDAESDAIFEYWIFGHQRMLAIWPYLKDSPVATQWGWSPLIHDAYRRNRHIFVPGVKPTLLGRLLGSTPSENYSDPIPGLLALHVRRGDFQDHCVHLGKWSSNWNAFNMFPEFSDKFQRPTDGGWGETSDKNMQMYMQRCFPTIEQIVQRVMQVRVESEWPLTHIYIMTNGAVAWVDELKEALAISGNWDQIRSSRDLEITWEQKFVAQGVGYVCGSKSRSVDRKWGKNCCGLSAGARLMNFLLQWSSLTSNVVMLRMARGLPPDSNRFW